MPYDGVSFTEAGYKITLPSELNIQAEMKAKAEAETFLKKLDESHKVAPDGRHRKNTPDHQKKEEKEESSKKEDLKELSVVQKKSAKYKVYFNQTNDMIEILDKNTGEVLETITPADLLALVSKSKTASGILVDKRI